jgi:hypothetical protein
MCRRTAKPGNIHSARYAIAEPRIYCLGRRIRAGAFVYTALTAILSATLSACSAPATIPRINQGPGINHSLRVALVIGNGGYRNGIEALPNPPHDAEAFAGVAQRHGFESLLLQDASLAEMHSALRAFAAAAEGAQVAMVFYSGHAIEVNGQNMFLPVDFPSSESVTEQQLEDRAFPLADMDMSLAGRATATLILVDACRSDPFESETAYAQSAAPQSRSISLLPGHSGLATQQGMRASAVVYATGPGMVAFDGAGAYSPFTTALLEHVEASGTNLPDFLDKVRLSVADATAGTQVPTWDQRALPAVLLFRKAEINGSKTPVMRMATATRPAVNDSGLELGHPENTNNPFLGLPLVEAFPPPLDYFYCDARTGRGWTKSGGVGNILVNRDGLACGMQIFGYPTQHIPAENLVVAIPPKAGHVVLKANSFAYVPNPGFIGSDQFRIEADGVSSSQPTLRMYGTINVTVR